MSVRPQHLENAKKAHEEGYILEAGATFSEE